MSTSATSIPKVRSGRWGPRLLIGLVIGYVAFLILAPIGGLIAGALQEGLGPVIEALTAPDTLAAFGQTLLIGLVVMIIHAVFGTAVAWVLV